MAWVSPVLSLMAAASRLDRTIFPRYARIGGSVRRFLEGLLGPDDLSFGREPGAPALGELGDEQQPPAALVRGARVAQMGRGVAAVEHLADQGPLPDQPEPDRADRVPDGVGDQFADDQFRGEGELLQA